MSKKISDEWTRATFIINKDLNDKLRSVAYWERLQVKDVLHNALMQYLDGRNETPSPKDCKPYKSGEDQLDATARRQAQFSQLMEWRKEGLVSDETLISVATGTDLEQKIVNEIQLEKALKKILTDIITKRDDAMIHRISMIQDDLQMDGDMRTKRLRSMVEDSMDDLSGILYWVRLGTIISGVYIVLLIWGIILRYS